MKRRAKHFCLNILLMLAVIGAGISPACKFISGQTTWMEICGAEGIKKILVADKSAPANPTEKHAVSNSCEFCITHSSVKTAPVTAVVFTMAFSTEPTKTDALYQTLLTNQSFDIIRLRGPPVLS